MLEHELQAVRQDIINAFAFNEFSTSSTAIDNCQVADKKQDLNNYDDHKNVVGCRQVFNIAATRRKGSSSCPLPPNAFTQTRIVRAVNQLPDHQNMIAKYCYTGEHNTWSVVECLSLYVWHHLQVFIEAYEQYKTSEKVLRGEPGKASPPHCLTDAKRQKLKGLVFSGLLHYRAGAVDGHKLYTVDVLCSLMGISSSNWRRDWAPFWNQILKTLSALDQSMLKSVYLSSSVNKVA